MEPSPSTSRRLARRAALGASLLVLALSACKPQAAKDGGRSKEPTPVQLHRVESQPLDRTVPTLGTLQAIDRATVSIKTTGRLRLLSVDVGSVVHAGDVLAQVEPRDYELRLRQSAALLAQARAHLGLPVEGDDDSMDLNKVSVVRETKALLEEATRTLERTRRLVADKIASDTEFERATTEHQVASNRHDDAIQEARERQALLAQRRAEFDIAKQQLSDTSLKSPFDGVVQERLTNVGEFLAAGSPVLTLVRVDPLRLRLEVPERLAAQVRPGQRVQVTLEGDTQVYEGRLLRVAPALDSRTRMLVTEAELRNPGNLRPGSFARASILVEESVPTITVPSDAVVSFAGIERVFLSVTNRAVERLITTGRKLGDRVEVTRGLEAGVQILRNPGGIQNGDAIREAAPTAPTASAKPAKLS